MLPDAPEGQRWIIFENGPVAFLAPDNFQIHKEFEDTIAIYPAGDSGITLRFSLHTKAMYPELPDDVAERFVADHAAAHQLPLTRLKDRVFLTESGEADWPDRRVLIHYWQVGFGRVLVVCTATIWGKDREADTIRNTLNLMPMIVDSIRLI
jgi:hypothetical protein